MPNTQPGLNPKHLGRFWPIFIVVVVAVVAAGIVLFYVSGSELQDNINSLTFFHKGVTTKTSPKPKNTAAPVLTK